MPTIQIPITVDTFIRNDFAAYVTWNEGVHPSLLVGSLCTALVKPDLSSVPVGATIIDASLSAYVYVATTGVQAVAVHRILKDWGEGAKQDEPATTGESNWTYAKHDTSAWATAGAKGLADRATTASSSLSVDAAVTGWRTFSGLADDVQAWLDGDSDNYGWGLYGSATVYVIFSSSDAEGDFGPYLEVEYISPDPPVTTTWHERTNRPAIPYDIEPQYERAFHGLYPAYPLDVTTLAHDGWNPEWNQMWANNPPDGATWHAREHAASSWTRRDSF